MQNPLFLLPQFRRFLPHSISELGQDLQVVLLVNRLTLGSTVSLIFSTFSSVFDVEGRPGRSSSSSSSRPPMNLLCHSETRVRDITLSTYIINSWKQSVGVLFQFHKQFQIDALLDFHPVHESGRATQCGHTQTKLRGKTNDIDESSLVRFEKVQV
jgi:hypothetical protein